MARPRVREQSAIRERGGGSIEDPIEAGMRHRPGRCRA